MSRVFTILVILGLIAVVALVPQMGTEEPGDPGPDLGDGYAYKPDTLRRFRLLLEEPGWSLADPARNPQGMLEAVHEGAGLTFVLVPAASFLMGSTDSEFGHLRNEAPVHRVRVRALLLSKTECTQSAWVNGGAENRSNYRRRGHPVEMVRWAECYEWCQRNGLRLPSEAEWEYGCRAGTTTSFSTGTRITTDQANYDGRWRINENDQGEFRRRTVAAGSLPANPWGLSEMHGNVEEWCEDTGHRNYEGAPPDGSAWISVGLRTETRVSRGGAWHHGEQICRSARRAMLPPRVRGKSRGFRPAASL